MRGRFVTGLSGVVAASVLTAVPAAAQSGQVLVSEPTSEELCALVADVDPASFDPAMLEQLLSSSAADLGEFEPEPVKGSEYDDLASLLGEVLDDSDEAVAVTVASDGDALLVSLVPDITACEGFEDLDAAGGLQAGNYLVEPALDDVCALADDAAAAVGEQDAASGTAPDGLEARAPQPATGDDAARFEEVGTALDGVLDSTDAAEVSATYDGGALVVTAMPSVEDCDVPVEVAAGVGGDGGADWQPWAAALLVVGLVTMAAAVLVRPARARARARR